MLRQNEPFFLGNIVRCPPKPWHPWQGGGEHYQERQDQSTSHQELKDGGGLSHGDLCISPASISLGTGYYPSSPFPQSPHPRGETTSQRSPAMGTFQPQLTFFSSVVPCQHLKTKCVVSTWLTTDHRSRFLSLHPLFYFTQTEFVDRPWRKHIPHHLKNFCESGLELACMVKPERLWWSEIWCREEVPAQPLACCVSSGKSMPLSGPQLGHVSMVGLDKKLLSSSDGP